MQALHATRRDPNIEPGNWRPPPLKSPLKSTYTGSKGPLQPTRPPQMSSTFPSKTVADLTESLASARLLYAATARRAASAWRLLKSASELRVWLDLEKAAVAVIEAEHFAIDGSDKDERVAAMRESLKTLFPCTRLGELIVIEVRPFFTPMDSIHSRFGLKCMSGKSLSYFRGLDVEVPAASDPEGPSQRALESKTIEGLNAFELKLLCEHYHGATLTLVNLLRDLATALNYPQSALKPGGSAHEAWVSAPKKEDPSEQLNALRALTLLPFTPEPARHFGSEALRINPLETLPPGEGIKALLSS